MAGIRDPAFWRRFSMAVHLDEEKANISDNTSTSTGSSKHQLKQSETWLERNAKKKRRTRVVGWVIALGFVAVIAGIVMVLMWYTHTGPFKPVKVASPSP